MAFIILILLIGFEASSQELQSPAQDTATIEGEVTEDEVTENESDQDFLQAPLEISETEMQETSLEPPRTCQNILDSENSFEIQIQQIARLDSSWDCFNEFYFHLFNEPIQETARLVQNIHSFQIPIEQQFNSTTQTTPERVLDIIRFIKGEQQYTPPHSLLYKIPPANTQFFSFGNIFRETSYNLYREPLPFILSSFKPIRNHLLSVLYVNDVYFYPLRYPITQEQLSIQRSYFNFRRENLSLKETELSVSSTTYHLPVFTFCSKEHTASPYLSVFYNTEDKVEALIQESQETYIEYLNLVNLQNIASSQENNTSISTLQMQHFVPYGFEVSDALNLTEFEKQNLVELVAQLKEYTFIKSVLLKDLECLNNHFQENISFLNLDPTFSNHGDASKVFTRFPEEKLSLPENHEPYLKIHYTFNEFPQAFYTFLNSSAKSSYTAFNIPYKQENDLFEYEPPLEDIRSSVLELFSIPSETPSEAP